MPVTIQELKITFVTIDDGQTIDTTNDRGAIPVPPIDGYLAYFGVDTVQHLAGDQWPNLGRMICEDLELLDNMTNELIGYIADEDLLVDITGPQYEALKAGAYTEQARSAMKRMIKEFSDLLVAAGSDYEGDDMSIYFEAQFLD